MTFPNPQSADAPGIATNRQVLAFVWSFWMKRKRSFALACVLTLAWTGLDLSLPIASSRLIAAVAPLPGDATRAWLAWRAYVLLFASYAIVRNLTFRQWARIAAFNMEAMTNEVFGRLQTAPAEWHANRAGGETIRRVVRAMWGYDAVTDAFTIWLAPSVVVLVGLCVALCWREPAAGLVALVAVLVFLSASVLLTARYVRPADLRSNRRDARLSGMLTDSLGANSVVKSFAAEHREAARIAAATASWRTSILVTWNRFIDLGLLQNLCLLALLAGLSGATLHAWTHGRADAGDLAFAITSFLVMSGYLRNVGENVRQLQRGFDDVSDAVSLRHERFEAVEPTHAASPLARGRIVFDDVGFSYPGAKRAVCERLNASIEPGEIVAVMGPSGTGKSTLVKLLQRLYEPQRGRITIDGVDIATVPLHTLRRSIAVAAQQPDLFHRTVFDNIAYPKPDASRAEVEDAARAAHADGFIAALPDGYDTVVGERGMKLSGGQRQRIALARALLADAPVVVLDEATSALDARTEQALLAGLRAQLAGRTCLFVTHRMSAARFADRVLHFAEGRLTEGPAGSRTTDEPSQTRSPPTWRNGASRRGHDTASTA